MSKKIRIYTVTTTFPGADSERHFYFRKKENAEEFEKTLENSNGVGWMNVDPEKDEEYEIMYGNMYYDDIWEMEKAKHEN